MLGTAQYLSPEQAQGLETTAASDLYSIGVMLYEALTGRVPFEAESPVAVALKQISEQPRPPVGAQPAGAAGARRGRPAGARQGPGEPLRSPPTSSSRALDAAEVDPVAAATRAGAPAVAETPPRRLEDDARRGGSAGG